MVRRNVEGHHGFSQFVAEQCGIFELGGLLLDRNWNFTAAVEAFELEREESRGSLSCLLDANGFTKAMYMDGVFARKLGVPFYIVAHIKGGSRIHVYALRSDPENGKLRCVDEKTLSEEAFLRWWQEKKGTVQTKGYRNDLQDRAKASYFDYLLESHGLKWGGNIDGFLVEDGDIVAIVENRFSNKTPLKKYDPNAFFAGYNGGDYNTWLPLINLKDRLGVPLFLMTYSYRDGEQNQVGITRVLGQSKDKGLLYAQDRNGTPIRPCDNVLRNLPDIGQWLARNQTPEQTHSNGDATGSCGDADA